MVVGQLKGNGTGLLDHHVKKGNMVVMITGFHLLGGGGGTGEKLPSQTI